VDFSKYEDTIFSMLIMSRCDALQVRKLTVTLYSGVFN